MNDNATPFGEQYPGSAAAPPPPPSVTHQTYVQVGSHAVPVTVVPQQVYAVTGPTNGLATAALTLGILAAVLCWVPFVGLILALVGVGLAIPALVGATSTGTGRIPAIWGLALSAFSFLMFFVIVALM